MGLGQPEFFPFIPIPLKDRVNVPLKKKGEVHGGLTGDHFKLINPVGYGVTGPGTGTS